MDSKKISYLAGPFFHKNDEVVRKRVQTFIDVTCDLMRSGKIVFSPIVHNYPLMENDLCDKMGNWDFWQIIDFAFLESCKELIVVTMDGWKESKGTAAEIAKANHLEIPIFYYNPKTKQLSSSF